MAATFKLIKINESYALQLNLAMPYAKCNERADPRQAGWEPM